MLVDDGSVLVDDDAVVATGAWLVEDTAEPLELELADDELEDDELPDELEEVELPDEPELPELPEPLDELFEPPEPPSGSVYC